MIYGTSDRARFDARPYRNREVIRPSFSDPPPPGWTPPTTLETGLRQMPEETRRHLDRPA